MPLDDPVTIATLFFRVWGCGAVEAESMSEGLCKLSK
jgi:hypothetical protein